MFPRPAIWTEKLLEMWFLSPHHPTWDLLNQKIWHGPRNLYFNKPSRWFWGMLRVEYVCYLHSKFIHPPSGKIISLHFLFSLIITHHSNILFLWCFSQQHKHLKFDKLEYKMGRKKETVLVVKSTPTKQFGVIWCRGRYHIVKALAQCWGVPVMSLSDEEMNSQLLCPNSSAQKVNY